jgi:hypothetical protein
MELPIRISTYTWYKTLEQKERICIINGVPIRALTFANAHFRLEFLALGVSGYSTWWFHVKFFVRIGRCTSEHIDPSAMRQPAIFKSSGF